MNRRVVGSNGHMLKRRAPMPETASACTMRRTKNAPPLSIRFGSQGSRVEDSLCSGRFWAQRREGARRQAASSSNRTHLEANPA